MLAVYRPAAVHEEGVTVAELDEALVPVEAQDGRQLAAGGHLAPWKDARPAKVVVVVGVAVGTMSRLLCCC